MKHILIFFLSEIHVRNNVLPKSTYKRSNGEEFTVIQTNETAIRALWDMLNKRREQIDCIFYFLSSRVKTAITYTDDEGKARTITQQDFFMARMKQEYGDLPCIPIAFDETLHPEMGIEQVTNMAQDIIDYVHRQGWTSQDVLLHADMTGGPRNAAMMMLSVMQLLKYDGFMAGEVLYSYKPDAVVKIENATDVYRMFNLVSGADEFVNFGSVEEIERYFINRDQSPELRHLLNTMRDFSDAIRICRPAIMRRTVVNLQEALESFEEKANKTLPELLFSKILKVFKKEYEGLLEPPVKRLEIIKWCVRHGFLQQAMTLCTEWLPAYIIDHQICYPVQRDSIQNTCIAERRENWKSWEQYFINEFYQSAGISGTALSAKNVCNHIKNAMQSYQGHQDIGMAVSTSPVLQEVLRSFFQEYNQASYIIKRYKKVDFAITEIQQRTPMIYRALRGIWRHALKNPRVTSSFPEFLRTIRMRKFWNYMRTLDVEALGEILQCNFTIMGQVLKQPLQDETILQGNHKWQQRGRKYHTMYLNGIITSRYTEDKMLSVLKDFFWIRTTRNSINHAEDSAISTAQDISWLITKAIERIEALE